MKRPKKFTREKCLLGEGAEYLFDSYKLNAGSAKIYIIDFKNLMDGNGFKRTLIFKPFHYSLEKCNLLK